MLSTALCMYIRLDILIVIYLRVVLVNLQDIAMLHITVASYMYSYTIIRAYNTYDIASYVQLTYYSIQLSLIAKY